MSAFAHLPWGRYVFVEAYRRTRKGRQEFVHSHLRRWPGDPGTLYFQY